MTEHIISALVALLGVVLSTLISLITSKTVVANEVQKLLFEAKKTYDIKLLEMRLKAYPGLFSLLSSFIKEIEFNFISRDALHTLLIEINDWDSKNAIVLSRHSAGVCYGYRHYLHTLLKENDKQPQVGLSSQEFLQTLKDRTVAVEYVLRSDLGIYGIRASENDIYDLNIIKSTQELENIGRSVKSRGQNTAQTSAKPK